MKLEQITLEQIWGAIVWIAGAIGVLGAIIGAITKICKTFKRRRRDEISEAVKLAVASEITPITKELSSLKEAMRANKLNSCKDFLVRFLADVEQGEIIDEVERERFYEVYEQYTSPELQGNSYIHAKVEKLKSEGKL